MDDSGFPRTPNRPVKLLGTCVRYLRSVETLIGARGPDFLGGAPTPSSGSTPSSRASHPCVEHLAYLDEMQQCKCMNAKIANMRCII